MCHNLRTSLARSKKQGYEVHATVGQTVCICSYTEGRQVCARWDSLKTDGAAERSNVWRCSQTMRLAWKQAVLSTYTDGQVQNLEGYQGAVAHDFVRATRTLPVCESEQPQYGGKNQFLG